MNKVYVTKDSPAYRFLAEASDEDIKILIHVLMQCKRDVVMSKIDKETCKYHYNLLEEVECPK